MNAKVCVVTGSRADYGLLKGLMREINSSPNLELQVIVTGMHLSGDFGSTYLEIQEDDFKFSYVVDMLLNSDSPAAIAKSIGIGVMGFADAFVNLQPNYLILLGDRFEVFAAASAAHTMGIPIVHLHGGEVTEGSIDDGYRHGITKLSSLHFTATTEYRNRVIQMGQWPKSVHVVGALGLDAIKNVMPVSQPALEDFLGISLSGDSLLVTLHPETHGAEPAEDQVTGMLDALARVDASLIFTMPNADSGGRKIWSFIESFVAENRSRACLHRSLGQDRYLSLLSRVSAVVGNSSSGIIEAPSFGIGTVNIGGRQAGRICANSVINCSSASDDIFSSINKALDPSFRKLAREVVNPYGTPGASKRIIRILNAWDWSVTSQAFYDL
ncbi:UDP-N-acetylglucosamine 2-epimerase [Luminiphilus sp.]|jgi:GDP/UDP-N,N'-diacetylbacillosamine 2-epimerase (hydrolysing)|nr:UDP-N-acetylglucosamine 2-epimerase [Luminiphilus sp.]